MGPETIALIVKIAFIVFFVLLILGIIGAAKRGTKKGIYRTTFNLVWTVVIFLIAYLCLDKVVELVGKIGLQLTGYKSVVITRADGVYYVAKVTTIKDTLVDAFKGYYLLYGINGNSQTAALAAYAIVESILKYVVYIVLTILILIIGTLLREIVWAIFKKCVPHISRKKNKVKVVAGIQNAVKYLAVSFVCAAPFSSLLNTLSIAYSKVDMGDNQSEIVKYIDSALVTYNDSIFAQALFNWNVDENGMSFDSQFMHKVTGSTVEELSVSLTETITGIVNIGTSALDAIDLSNGFAVNYTALLSGETIKSVLDAISNSQIISLIIPVAAEMAMNEELLKMDTTLFDVSEMSLEEELGHVSSIVDAIINTGALDMFIDSSGNFAPNFNLDQVLDIVFNPEKREELSEVFNQIKESQLISKLLPAVIYKFANQSPQLGQYLPTNWDEISDIDWGFELKVVFDNVFDLVGIEGFRDLLGNFIPEASPKTRLPKGEDKPEPTEPGENPGEDPTPSGNNDMIASIVEFASNNIDEVKKALVGDGGPVDENGRTIVYVDGVKQENKKYCLLDCSMFKKAFGAVSDLLVEKVGGFGFDPNGELSEVIGNLNKGSWRKNYKDEYGSIFDCLGTVKGKSDVLMELINNFSLDAINDDVAEIAVDFLPKIDDSKILSTCLGGFLSSKIGDFEETLSGFGLDGELIKASVEHFSREHQLGHKFVDLASKLSDVMNIVGKVQNAGDDIITSMTEGDTYLSLAKVLDTLYDSEIINPTYYYDNEHKIVICDREATISGKYVDMNYLNVLDYLFNDMLKLPGLSFDRAVVAEAVDGHWTNSYDSDGNIVLDGENGRIANIIHVLGSCKKDDVSIIDAITNSDILTTPAGISSLATDYHIGDFLRAIAVCETFKATLGDFLDTQLESVGVIDTEQHISFKNVSNWTAEVNNLETLLIDLGKINISLDDLDLSAISDVANMNNLLHSLANSEMFSYKNVDTGNIEYKFGNWLYTKIGSALGDFSLGGDGSLVSDPETWLDAWGEKDPSITDNILKHDFLSQSEKVNWFNPDYDFTVTDDPYYENTGDITYWTKSDFLDRYNPIFAQDEIGRLCKVIFYAGKLAGGEEIDLANVSMDDFSGLLNAINDCNCLRVCVYNVYATAQSMISGVTDLINLDAANTPLLISGSKNNNLDYDARVWRAKEIDSLVSMFDLFTSISGDEGFTLSSLNSEVIGKLSDAIVAMSRSDVFHRAGPSSVDTTKPWNPTTLQSILFSLTSNEQLGLAGMLYNAENPKDIKLNSTYTPYAISSDTSVGQSKMRYLINNNFAYELDNSDEYINEENEIKAFFNVLTTFMGGELPANAVEVSALPEINTTEVGDSYKVTTAITTTTAFIEGAGLTYPAGSYVTVVKNSADERKFDVIAGLVDDQGNSTLDFTNINFGRKDNSQALINVLKAMDNSVLLKDAAPNAIADNLTNISIGSFNYIDINSANVYHNYYTKGIESTIDDIDVDASFSENDYDTLSYLLEQVGLQTAGEPCDIPDFSDISDFSKENDPEQTKIAGLENFVNTLMDSDMFHAAGPVLTVNPLTFAVSYKDSSPKTFVQSVFLELFHNEAIEGLLYNSADTAKNTAKGYTNAAVKIDSIISTNFPATKENATQKAEFSKICNFISKASEMSDLDFEGDITSLDTASIKELLLALNETDTMFDAIPNLMNDIFNGDFSGFDGVNFSDATVYYAYNKTTVPNYDAKYDDSEIDTICKLIEHFKNLNEVIGEGSLADLSTIFSMTELDGSGESMLTNLLNDAASSHILHVSNEYKNNYTHLTVFEQLVNSLVSNSTMDDYIYSYDTDGFASKDSMMKFYIKKVTITEVGKILVSNSNLNNALVTLANSNIYVRESGNTATQSYIIVESKDLTAALTAINASENIATGELAVYNNTVGYHNDWISSDKNDEIHALNNFLNTAGSVMGGSGSLSFGGSGLSLSSLSPEKVSSLMEAINKVDIISRAVPAFIKTGFTSIGFNSKTTYKGADVTNYGISQKDFGGIDGNISAEGNENAEINLVTNVLNALASRNGEEFVGYADMGGDFISTISGDGLTAIFDFLGESKMLTTGTANFVTSENEVGLSAKGNGLVLYNLLDASDGMTQYITGSNSDQKLGVLTRLMNDENSMSAAEAKAIKYICADATNLTSAGDSDMSALSSDAALATSLVDCMRDAYRGGSENDNAGTRAFVASDIIANIFNTLLDTEIDNINNQSPVFYYDPSFRFGEANYANIISSTNLNDVYADICSLEADGVESGLDLIGALNGSYHDWDTSVMQAAFNKMDNGRFAKILYISRIHSSVRYILVPTLCTLYDYTPNLFEDNTLLDATSPIYADGFTFKSTVDHKGYGELIIEDIEEVKTWL